MTVRKSFKFATAIFAALAVANVPTAHADANHRLSDVERKECIAKGGRAAFFGLLGGEDCELPMPDAGKSCTDSRQCQSRECTLDEAKPGFVSPNSTRKTGGICAATNFGFGCKWRLQNGIARKMCVD